MLIYGMIKKAINTTTVGLFISLWIIILMTLPLTAGEYKLHSPDKHTTVTVTMGEKIYYSVMFHSKTILTPSPISLTLANSLVLGVKPKVKQFLTRSVNRKLKPVVKQKSAVIQNTYNQLEISFKKKYRLIFRAYNDAVVYRFVLNRGKKIKIFDEEVVFNFGADHNIYFPTETRFMSHQERMYEYIKLSSISEKKFSSLPALVDMENGPTVAILEADLQDYAGMYLRGNNKPTLTAKFPGVALKVQEVDLKRRRGDRNIYVLEHAGYIAETNGTRSLPWRVLAIAKTDGELVTNDIVYKLAAPLKLKDTSWIKPGKVAWDWWNFNNIYGVDFEAGLNTETYKYYIDFAAKYGLDYIILDEGWYKLGDLFQINPDIDMEHLMAYAKKKNVGIILWVIWKTLDDQLVPALDKFEKWGVKGIKVDFMQRDDQWMVNYYWRIAREAAKRKMIVDFHGSYTPRGLRRAYPNVLTRESLKGLEHYKWKSEQGPEHEVTLPFIRMLAGPMDYTPGAMINAQKKDYYPRWNTPMSKGTRARQLAMYVIYESPLQMLADNPTHYLREPENMEFLARVPVVWDETRVILAKIGDYIAIARRNGKEWYIGAMTDWTPRELELNLDFLPEKSEYKADIFMDGPNAHRNGNDYKRIDKTFSKGSVIKINLAPGGGWAARLFH